MKLTILIPIYNEEATLQILLDRVLSQPLPEAITAKELILIDDASQDASPKIIEEYIKTHPEEAILFLRHEKNQGKGKALKTGAEKAQGDIILIQDADLEYHPREYPKLLQPIIDGVADVVYGSRFLGGPHRVLLFWHYLGNKGLTFFSNLFTNLNLTDMETCYKVFRREVLCPPRWRSRRFGFEPEITAMVAHGKWRVYEVPISYFGRTYDEGKKITPWDGVKALFVILYANLREVLKK